MNGSYQKLNGFRSVRCEKEQAADLSPRWAFGDYIILERLFFLFGGRFCTYFFSALFRWLCFQWCFPIFSLSFLPHTHTHTQYRLFAEKVKTSRKTEQYQNNSHLSCFEKWLKIFCKASVFGLSPLDARWLAACLLGPAVVNVWEIKRGANWRQVKKPSESLSSTYAHGTVRISHWNRIAFILKYQLRERRTMAIHIAAFI